MILPFLSYFIINVIILSVTNVYTQEVTVKEPEINLNNKNDGFGVDLVIQYDDYNVVQYYLDDRLLLNDTFDELHDQEAGNNPDDMKDEDKSPILNILHRENNNRKPIKAAPIVSKAHSITKREVPIVDQETNENNEVAEENVISSFINPFQHLRAGFAMLKAAFSFNATNCNCTEDICDRGIKRIKCLYAKFQEHKQPISISASKIWRISLIWIAVYGLIAIPFWCIKGWCCCCLRCKFFKPQDTIQEAKNYLLLNPPGVLVTKKGAIFHYEPTEREKDCYEEFEHFMRTL